MIYPINALTAQEIANATGGRLIYGSGDVVVSSVSTDSRTVDNTTLYIPIKGENFDGHTFICDVTKHDVAGYLCSDGQICGGSGFAIMVDDTRKALLDLASYYRSLFKIPVVGLTGSVGKTTTKEFVASVLAKGYNTLATKGNFNNDIGVPLTIFGLENSHEAAVIEMGMSNFGEIEVLSKCARPDVAIITNIGTSHIEFLGSREGILKAKTEIFEGLSKNGKVILNGDDPYLWGIKKDLKFETLYFGMENPDCDIIATDIVSDENGSLFKCEGKEYRINPVGIHNIYNALAAIAAGKILGLSYEKVYAGLKSFTPGGIRQNIISCNGYKVINDCYNSSPQSVKAALGVLDTVSAKRRIAVLGSIGELGEKSKELHEDIGTYVTDSETDILITVGEDAKYIALKAKNCVVHSFDTTDKAIELLKKIIQKDDAILVKASRFMKFEVISESITQ